MKKFVIKIIANMAGIYVASLTFTAISVSSWQAVFWAGIVLGLVNLLIRPLLLLVSLPINLITLGLFTLVINAWLVMLATGHITGIHIPSFLLALATAIIISILNTVLDHLLNKHK